jgi:hypothetical protein
VKFIENSCSFLLTAPMAASVNRSLRTIDITFTNSRRALWNVGNTLETPWKHPGSPGFGVDSTSGWQATRRVRHIGIAGMLSAATAAGGNHSRNEYALLLRFSETSPLGARPQRTHGCVLRLAASSFTAYLGRAGRRRRMRPITGTHFAPTSSGPGTRACRDVARRDEIAGRGTLSRSFGSPYFRDVRR